MSFHGLKLLQYIPARPAFDGSGLGVAVTRCRTKSASEMLEPENMRTKPFRSYGPPQLDACHEALLAYAETVTERQLPEPYPHKHEQPVGVAFVPSEIIFDGTFLPASRMIRVNSGPYSGKVFMQWDRPAHWLLLLEKVSRRERRKQRKAHDGQAKKIVTLSAVSNSDLRCIGCGEREIDNDNFLLCFYCTSNDAANYGSTRLAKGDLKKRKDNGFQDDEKSLSVYTYPFLDEPHGNENSKLDETNNNRPLDETELAWILAAKYKGFMVKGTKAYKKARRAAAQLAGHYVLGKSFAEIAKIVDGKENSVNRFCTRSRKEYADNMVRGPMPEGVRTALAKGLLRELYPPAVTTGYLVRSA